MCSPWGHKGQRWAQHLSALGGSGREVQWWQDSGWPGQGSPGGHPEGTGQGRLCWVPYAPSAWTQASGILMPPRGGGGFR